MNIKLMAVFHSILYTVLVITDILHRQAYGE